MTSFADLGLGPRQVSAAQHHGYQKPTPIQIASIPPILAGGDILGAAPTGTGKTAAFGLALLEKIKARRKRSAPAALILSPTRELAEQTELFFTKSARITRHRILALMGGFAYERQERKLREGVDILIATPGRLLDLLTNSKLDLSHLSMLVVDEADRMLDMGFLPDVKRILEQITQPCQVILFSATLSQDITKILQDKLHKPVYIDINERQTVPKTITQRLIPIPQRYKPALLSAVLSHCGFESTIVFVQTQGTAEEIVRELQHKGYRAGALHAKLTQAQRRNQLTNFKKGSLDVLITTSVLARGIDIQDVMRIINYDLPDTVEEYIHRIGRTGRAGKSGIAFSFITPRNEALLKKIEAHLQTKLPRMSLEEILELPLVNGAAPLQKTATQKPHEQAKRTKKIQTSRPLKAQATRQTAPTTSVNTDKHRRGGVADFGKRRQKRRS